MVNHTPPERHSKARGSGGQTALRLFMRENALWDFAFFSQPYKYIQGYTQMNDMVTCMVKLWL